jgi:anaerobic C4-dicarboxylate transporter
MAVVADMRDAEQAAEPLTADLTDMRAGHAAIAAVAVMQVATAAEPEAASAAAVVAVAAAASAAAAVVAAAAVTGKFFFGTLPKGPSASAGGLFWMELRRTVAG